MEEVFKYLKECGTFYLATNEGDQPRVRPFGAVCEFEGKLYIVTNNEKKVYSQMLKNRKIEISGMANGTWIRIACEAVPDSRREARAAMMEENKAALSNLYTVDDNRMEVLYLQNARAVISSFTSDPVVIQF